MIQATFWENQIAGSTDFSLLTTLDAAVQASRLTEMLPRTAWRQMQGLSLRVVVDSSDYQQQLARILNRTSRLQVQF